MRTRTPATQNRADWGTHSYTINIGTASADRIVVVFACNWAAGGNVAALLNSNAMTVCPGATTGGGIDAIAAWYLNVPTGTTANLTLHQLQTAKWGVYTIKNQSGGASATPAAGGYVTQAGSGDVSFSLTVPSGGAALMAGFPSASANADITWTNATEDHDATAAQNNSFAHATASATVTSHSADDGYRYTSGGVLWVTWDA